MPAFARRCEALHTDRCAQHGTLGPERLKKELRGQKLVIQGVRAFFFSCTPRGTRMSCNASLVHDGFLFSLQGSFCFWAAFRIWFQCLMGLDLT